VIKQWFTITYYPNITRYDRLHSLHNINTHQSVQYNTIFKVYDTISKGITCLSHTSTHTHTLNQAHFSHVLAVGGISPGNLKLPKKCEKFRTSSIFLSIIPKH